MKKLELKRNDDPGVLRRRKVVIAMSGGVDSSVTAALLKEGGYDCIGMHLEFWVDPLAEKSDHGSGVNGEAPKIAQNKCCTLEGLVDARRVCAKLEIPFYVMNVVDEFKEKVVDHFLDTYAAGATPNPCIACNRNIKFGQLLTRARELGADFLATGHYAKIEKSECYQLKKARDLSKDQSYFLYHMTQEKLSRVLFPLGDLLKSEVYDLARKFGLEKVAEKDESQGLCFFAESKPMYFLRRYLPKEMFNPGEIVTVDGRIVGTHKGLPLYTIGQRQGLGIGGIAGEPEGMPWFVVEIDRENNRLVVGREKDIIRHSLICSDIEFINGKIPTEPVEIEVRIRHRGTPIAATLTVQNGKGIVQSAQKMKGIAPGQAAVFYQGDTVIGGGIIGSSRISYIHEREKKSSEEIAA